MCDIWLLLVVMGVLVGNWDRLIGTSVTRVFCGIGWGWFLRAESGNVI